MLPVEEFPQFASRAAAEYLVGSNPPFAPVEGERYAGALHEDASYMRLTRTIDLTGRDAAPSSRSSSRSTSRRATTT